MGSKKIRKKEEKILRTLKTKKSEETGPNGKETGLRLKTINPGEGLGVPL